MQHGMMKHHPPSGHGIQPPRILIASFCCSLVGAVVICLEGAGWVVTAFADCFDSLASFEIPQVLNILI